MAIQVNNDCPFNLLLSNASICLSAYPSPGGSQYPGAPAGNAGYPSGPAGGGNNGYPSGPAGGGGNGGFPGGPAGGSGRGNAGYPSGGPSAGGNRGPANGGRPAGGPPSNQYVPPPASQPQRPSGNGGFNPQSGYTY